ncbi:hypothetical protein Y887_15440 [Xanthomonas pisi DSM 18956]|uniref:Uncharacterized protein n=1 Tax=Xanthomonas pisi TaxID=56457 RepID=A0A2S7D7R7_9XANT|nr:hypothetical protein Y887_15440 [Xanthomonas pisi DSM 18956]PPU69856.1 hypothetical protein XpiCFBP4643_03295 [Xanthomonas pisi]
MMTVVWAVDRACWRYAARSWALYNGLAQMHGWVNNHQGVGGAATRLRRAGDLHGVTVRMRAA